MGIICSIDPQELVDEKQTEELQGDEPKAEGDDDLKDEAQARQVDGGNDDAKVDVQEVKKDDVKPAPVQYVYSPVKPLYLPQQSYMYNYNPYLAPTNTALNYAPYHNPVLDEQVRRSIVEGVLRRSQQLLNSLPKLETQA